MIKLLTGLLNKESGTASVSFTLLAAGASIVVMGVIKLIGAKIGFVDCGLYGVLRYVQVYRLIWDASNMQCVSRAQQNERYYVSDPVGSQENAMSTMASLLACVKHALLAG
jgi:hypothetical protein